MLENEKYCISYYGFYSGSTPLSEIVCSRFDLERRISELEFLGYTRISYWRI